MRAIPFLIILLLLVQACKVREPQKSSEMSDLGWKLLDKYVDGNGYMTAPKANEALNVFEKAIKLDNKNSAAHLGRGAAYFYLNDFDAAIKNYSWVIKNFPKIAEAYSNVAGAYLMKGDTSNALDFYKRSKEINPKNYSADVSIGSILIGRKDYEKAITYLNTAIGGSHYTARTYNNRGAAYKGLAEYDKALKDYDRAILIDSSSYVPYEGKSEVYYRKKMYKEVIIYSTKALKRDSMRYNSIINRGIAYDYLKQYDKAEEDYRRLVKYFPNDPYAYYNLGRLRESRNLDSALLYYSKAIKADSNYAEAWYARGICYSDKNNDSAALKNFELALKIDPKHYRAINGRGNVHYWNKDYEKAIADYLEVIKIAPDFVYGHSNLASTYQHLDKIQEARMEFNKALQADSTVPKVWSDLGSFYSYMENVDSALICYDKAIRLDSTYSLAYHNRARTYHFKKKDPKKAKADYLMAVRLDTTVSELYNNFAMLYSDLKEYKQAIECFLKAIRLKPDFTYSYNNLANCYFKQGETANACKYWQQALDHGYVYDPKWKKEYDIDDPKELIQKHCK